MRSPLPGALIPGTLARLQAHLVKVLVHPDVIAQNERMMSPAGSFPTPEAPRVGDVVTFGGVERSAAVFSDALVITEVTSHLVAEAVSMRSLLNRNHASSEELRVTTQVCV